MDLKSRNGRYRVLRSALLGCGALVLAVAVRGSALAGPSAAQAPASISNAGLPAQPVASAVQEQPPAAQLGAALEGGGIVNGSTPRRLLHFTFDDGPDAQQTPRALEALDKAGVKATFFFSTSRFASRERRNAHAAELAHEVARRGHQLGAHGFDHTHMAKLGAADLTTQVSRTEAMFLQVFGQRTFLFRPPFGSRNPTLDGMLGEGRYVTVDWNIGMADWVARAPEAIEKTFFRVLERNAAERGERGGIVLLHDTHAWSVEAFKLITRSLAARNCELLGRGEELFVFAESLAPFIHPPSDADYAGIQATARAAAQARCGTEAPAR